MRPKAGSQSVEGLWVISISSKGSQCSRRTGALGWMLCPGEKWNAPARKGDTRGNPDTVGLLRISISLGAACRRCRRLWLRFC